MSPFAKFAQSFCASIDLRSSRVVWRESIALGALSRIAARRGSVGWHAAFEEVFREIPRWSRLLNRGSETVEPDVALVEPRI